MDFYEKTLSRILPIPPDAVSAKWDNERIRTEAEMWCKPFACAIQGCSEPRVRTDSEKFRCQEAPKYLQMCVNHIIHHIEDIIVNKNS